MAARTVQSIDAAYQMILVVVVFMCSGFLFLFNVYPEKAYASFVIYSCVLVVGGMILWGVILLISGSLLSRAVAWVVGISCPLIVFGLLLLFAAMPPGALSRLKHLGSLIVTGSLISGVHLVDRSVLPAYESAFANQYPDIIFLQEKAALRKAWPSIRKGILGLTLCPYLWGLVQFLRDLISVS